MQLLSPARDIEVGRIAIQAGADAVYIGAPKYGARQAAGNSIEDIASLVQYANRFGVQVLVTLNTLLNDDERDEAVAMAKELHQVGIHALIVQDLSFAARLHKECPQLRLHASTQCDNRTSEQVRRLYDMGFSRVVLARELGIDEIRAIHQAVPEVELEVFVHGALCVSYSGRCYMSEVIMGRSANRGCCAQMCRMAYDLLDEDMEEVKDDNGQPIHQRYLLSLKDLDRSMYLSELMEAGVTTCKIEGRLKDADYVANITAYYRQKLDSLNSNRSTLHSPTTLHYSFTPNPEKTFHRGQTDYFLHGRTPNLSNWLTPKSTGEKIGRVSRVERNGGVCIELAPGIELHNGDGLCVGEMGFAVNGIEPVSSTCVRVIPNHAVSLHAREYIYRNMDTHFAPSKGVERRVGLSLTFCITKEGYCLKGESNIGRQASLEVVVEHQPASNPQRALVTLQEQLSKVGDSNYWVQSITFVNEQGLVLDGGTYPYFIPISQINLWRRQLLNAL